MRAHCRSIPSARKRSCPNIGECWQHGTATFMILGDTCTRSCGYCNVKHGTPGRGRFGTNRSASQQAVAALGLDYVVVTSVDRDDLPDGGASVFAASIRAIRRRAPGCRVEVLIPDFLGPRRAARGSSRRRPRHPEPQPGDGRASLPHRAPRRALPLGAQPARPGPALPPGRTDQVRRDGRPGGNDRRTARRPRRPAGGRLRDRDDRPVPPPLPRAPAGRALLPPRRVRRSQAVAPSQIGFRHVESGSAGPQLLPRARRAQRRIGVWRSAATRPQ